MLGRESNHGPEVQWAFHKKPVRRLTELLWPVPGSAGCPRLLPICRWAAWAAAARQLTANLCCSRNWKSIGTTQNLLIQCLSPDVYVVGYRWTFHDQFCIFEAYRIYRKFKMIHLHRHLTCTDFLLFEGTRICTKRFLSPFLNIWPKGLGGYEMGMKMLHISWKCDVVWIVNACICIFRASHQKHLHSVCV